MGGLVCAIPKHAILRFDGIPEGHNKLKEFDSQLRRCFEQPQIVEAVANTGRGEEAYHILEKQEWGSKDRSDLYEILNQAVYE